MIVVQELQSGEARAPSASLSRENDGRTYKVVTGLDLACRQGVRSAVLVKVGETSGARVTSKV